MLRAKVALALLTGLLGVAATTPPSMALARPKSARTDVSVIRVTATDRHCTVSPKTIRQGPALLRIANHGRRVHAFALAGIRRTVLRGRRTVVFRITFATAGTYRYACSIRGRRHVTRGALTVIPSHSVAPAPPDASQPCGLQTPPPSVYKHVVWIVMENRDYSQIVGSPDAPYVNQLAKMCGLATNFYAETHPSLPNYIALTSGGTQGITSDVSPKTHQLQVPNIFSQLGSSWRVLQESMPAPCSAADSAAYSVATNPATYFVDIKAKCRLNDVPLGESLDLSARLTLLTPDLCNDGHNCTTAVGDRWLSTWIPRILDSPEYAAGSTALFLTWDEAYGNVNHIATIVVAPSTPSDTTAAARFDHYSILRTTEELLGLAYLGQAASAASMRTAFHL